MSVTLEDVAYRVLPRVHTGRLFAESEWRTLVAAAEVLLEGAAVSLPARRVADNVERFLFEGRSRRAWRVRVLLTTIELSTLPLYGKRFSELSLDERRRVVVERFARGGHIWRLCAKVRLLVMMGAYGDERASEAVGYVPVAERPRLSNQIIPLRVPPRVEAHHARDRRGSRAIA